MKNGGTYFLGRYRVVDEIGIGGMASVHLGRMDGPGGFQKWVAIKRIHSHLIEDETFIQMFLDEARVAARISHPNVATVFELGKHEDTYWIAMEYLHGEPLREVMRRTDETGQPMPPEIACRVIADAAEGLHAAHELLGKNGEKLQLVHRDVTPHNLFVTYDGCTKVVDFGIAKFSSRMSNTRAGTLKGKLAYMSPEQVHGEGIDRRTDIFALGVVLWELTTGQRLFRMDSDLDTLAKVQECNVARPSTMVRGYPIDLEKIVMKALSKNRGERFKTAREFSRALQSLLMRRGLFIASDEVASYVQSIFQERIQKREAHLRWAADVTQTISLDGMLAPQPAAPAEASMVTFNSEVQPAAPSTGRSAPRPAAGMPAVPQQRQPSRPPSGYPPRPHGAPIRETSRPPAMGGAVPPPPQMMAQMMAPPPDDGDDGPTIQAPPHMNPGANLSGPRQPSPIGDDPPTMQANPGARAAMIAAMVQAEAAAEAGREPPAYDPDGDFDDDDGDDTIVTTTKIEQAPQQQHARPIPAAGRPASADRLNRTMPLQGSAQQYAPPRPASRPAPAPLPPAPLPPVAMSPPPPRPRDTDEQRVASFSPRTSPPSDARMSAQMQQHLQQQQQYQQQEYAPQYAQNEYAQSAGQQPRLFAPPLQSSRHARTETSRALKRRVPMWMVGLASGTFFLLVVAVVVFVMMRNPKTSVPTAATSGARTASPPTASAKVAATAVPAAGARGPFYNARSGFLTAIGTTRGAANTPMPMPTQTQLTAATAAQTFRPADPTPPTPTAIMTAATGTATAPTPTAAPVAPTPAVVPPPVQPTVTPPTATVKPGPGGKPGPAVPTPNPTPTTPRAGGSSGFLSIVCFPACDQVIDNGKPLGPSPIWQRPVTVGEHRLKLTTSNPPATKIVSVIVAAEELKTVKQTMSP